MKYERYAASTYVIHYPNVADMLKDQAKGNVNEMLRKRYLIEGCAQIRGWYGPKCNSPMEFRANVDLGWPALLKRVKEMASQLQFKPDTLPVVLTQSMKRRRVRTDMGNDLDIHSVYQGQIDRAWSSTRRELHHARRRAAHVYIATAGNANESATDSLWRAAAAYRICEVFQRSGYSVEITCGSSSYGVYQGKPGQITHVSFTAKASNQPLDLTRLALQSTLGWFRVYNFAAFTCNDQGLDCTYYLGQTAHGAVSPYVQERIDSGELAVIVPSHVCDERTAMQTVRQAQKLLEKEAA